MTNPFMNPALANNPFAAPAPPAQPPAVQIPSSLVPGCGDPNCKRSHRPDGSSHYSFDRAQRMAELAEDNKMGPQFGKLGGVKAKSKKRALEVVAEAAAEHAEDIKQVFLDGIDPSNPIGMRISAAEKFLKIEEGEVERDLKTRQAEFDQMNKEQLASAVHEMLSKLNSAGMIAKEVRAKVDNEDYVDAEVVNDDD